ncbi:MAG: acetoacetate decarboxylase family protein [Candidatus Lokiarchaeota archaeon]|nr:acetoacetate decarboxylase family protein [Candidatus Lokiarchaeota archaeon]
MTESKNRGLNPKNKEEHAYYSGMLIQRVRNFVKNDDIEEFINWGEGSSGRPAKDPKTVKVGGDIGTNGIFSAFKPVNLELYKSFIPNHLIMPEDPIVSLVTVDYNYGSPIRRYNEGMVMIKCMRPDGKETWFVLSMPVETWLMMEMGVDWGFPKRLFNITVTRENTVVLEEGITHLSLEISSDPSLTERDVIIPSGEAWGINNMAVVHPVRKDVVLVFSYGPISVQERINGMVKVKVDRAQDWAALIPDDLITPGVFQRFIPIGDSMIKKIFLNR